MTVLDVLHPAGWKLAGLCRWHDPDLWHDPDPSGRETALAVEICGGCPVRLVCLEAGLAGGESGVWGGVRLEFGRPQRRHGRRP